MGVLRGIEGAKGPWEMFTRTILDQEGVVRWKLILQRRVGCVWPRNVGLWVTGVAWSRSREGKGRWKKQQQGRLDRCHPPARGPVLPGFRKPLKLGYNHRAEIRVRQMRHSPKM